MINFILAPFQEFLNDKSISIHVKVFSLLIIAIPPLLITGPALPDIILSLTATYFLLLSVTKKNFYYYSNSIAIGFLFFSFYGIIRSLFSDIPIESLTNEGSIFFFRYIFFALGVWYILDKNSYFTECLIISCMLCLIFVSFDGLFQYFFNHDIFGNPKLGAYRLTGPFGKEPIIGRYIAYLSIFTFSLTYLKYKKSNIILAISSLIFTICGSVVFLSGERSPFFIFFIFFFLALIFFSNIRKYFFLAGTFSILMLFLIFSINPLAKERMIDFTLHQMNQKSLSFLPYSKAHEKHYIAALKMFSDNPLIGVGTNTFRFNSRKVQFNPDNLDINSHPHNYYLQVLAELGIVGFLFLITFIISLLYKVIKQSYNLFRCKNSDLNEFEFVIFPLILLVFLFPFIPHMSFYNNWNNILIALPLGFYMRYFYGNKN